MPKKIQRLITFGDSFTYGDDLKNPQESCWPRLLANHLNVELINRACPGNSNDFMMDQVLLEKYTFFDFVIVCFSSITRLYFEDEYGGFETINESGNFSFSRNELIKIINASLSTEWLYRRWLAQAIYLQEFLKSRNVKYFFVFGFGNDDFQKYNTKKNRELHDLISKNNFIGWPNESFDSLTSHLPRGQTRHPLENSHVFFAKTLLKSMKSIYDLPKDY